MPSTCHRWTYSCATFNSRNLPATRTLHSRATYRVITRPSNPVHYNKVSTYLADRDSNIEDVVLRFEGLRVG